MLNLKEIGNRIKKYRKQKGFTQAQLAETIGTTGQYVNRIIKKQDGVVNKTFVQMLEALGYDIELTYVKREV
jgi:transcriptional regulator with XRE-family HTH domain